MAFKRRSEDLFDNDRFWKIAEEVMTASEVAENIDKKAKEEVLIDQNLLNAEDAFKKAKEAKLKKIISTVNEAVSKGAYSILINESLGWDICKVFEQKGYRVFRQPETQKTTILWGICRDY